jgi:hypothetical protein
VFSIDIVLVVLVVGEVSQRKTITNTSFLP